MRRALLTIGCLLFSGGAFANVVDVFPEDPVDIVRYTLSITPNIDKASVAGVETIRIFSRAELREIIFSSNALKIHNATIDGRPAEVSSTEEGVVFNFPQAIPQGRTSTLQIRFSGTPKRGLVAQDRLVYSSYFACDWMFCRQDFPGDKAFFELDLYLPEGVSSIGTGRPLRPRAAANGLTVHRWRTSRPYSPYLFGFTAGKLQFALQRRGRTHFTYAASKERKMDLRRLFAETSAISDFLADKAGLPLPDRQYTQLLVRGQEAQETASFSLIGADVLQRGLGDPASQWIIAHEMSHQWWGNLVTCQTWQDFWLNEGFATFMTAAWKQRRFGEEAYQAELDVARKRLKQAADLGYDKPLAWNGTYPSLKTRRAVQYSKGALFLDHLRAELGDRNFWKGVQIYTRMFAGKTVRSSDFERVMAKTSGRDLSGIFAEWVYGAPADMKHSS